jgi:ABC-type polysaccharide/polyol phosphate export permease
VGLGASLLLVPFYCFTLVLMTYTLSHVLSVAFVYFRDLRHIMGIIVQLWFYATPVLYDESMVPEKYSWILYLNPMAHVFTGLHDILVRGVWSSSAHVTLVCAWSAASLVVAYWVQKEFCIGLVERI